MKTCSFNSANSHRDRLLTDHLLEVAREADRTMGTWPMSLLPEGFRQVALLVCLCHDTGKATPWFQRRLETGGAGKLTRHAAISAAITRGVLERATAAGVPAGDMVQAMAVVAVWKHHGHLVDILSGDQSAGMLAQEAREASQDPDRVLAQQWRVFDWEGFGAWLAETAGEFEIPAPVLGPKPDTVGELFPTRRWGRTLKKLRRTCSARDAVIAQLLFSLLIGSDKLDAALYGRIPEVDVEIAADAVARYRLEQFGEAPGQPADELREAVWRDVARTLASHRDGRLFTVTAPTGAGKTLTALETALTLATRPRAGGSRTEPARSTARDQQARIVYCLPFTSIVDQNFAVIQKVLETAGTKPDSSALVKHHHLSDATWYGSDEGREREEFYEGDQAQLLIESWKSKIVVTTFVQFLEALLGNRNRMLKKLMQLPGAVVLLDEVQTIPRGLWEVVREAIMAWSDAAGTRFVLLTATRPLIFREGDAIELCRDKARHFSGLNRVTLVPRLDEPMTIETFAEELLERIREAPDRSRLVVVNTIASARSLYEALKERQVARHGVVPVYLSTHLTPRDRLRRIRRIREDARPWLVVSTQLVEAGVDISMDEVYRDLAPLDAIIQAAGRCNRGGEREGGRVTVLRLVDERGQAYGPRVYGRILLEVSERLLAGRHEIPEHEFLRLGEAYFERMWQATASEEDYLEALQQLDFDMLGGVKLISVSSRTQTYFVIASGDAEAEHLWETYMAIRDGEREREEFRRIKRAFSERLIDVRTWEPVEREVLALYSDGPEYYDAEVGYRHGDGSAYIL